MYDVAIIGGGTAGGSAAIFAAKANKKTVVIDSDQSMTRRAWIENHYGVPEVSGPDLIETGKRQAVRLGAEWVTGKVSNIEPLPEGGFSITTDEAAYQAKHIILATGALVDLAEKIGLEIVPGTEPRIKSIVKTDASGRTKVNGIWAAGTCAGVSVHTIITAGDGAKVAINVISELNGERYVDHDVLQK